MMPPKRPCMTIVIGKPGSGRKKFAINLAQRFNGSVEPFKDLESPEKSFISYAEEKVLGKCGRLRDGVSLGRLIYQSQTDCNQTIVVEDLAGWIRNLHYVFAGQPAAIAAEIRLFLGVLAERRVPLIIVTPDVREKSQSQELFNAAEAWFEREVHELNKKLSQLADQVISIADGRPTMLGTLREIRDGV